MNTYFFSGDSFFLCSVPPIFAVLLDLWGRKDGLARCVQRELKIRHLVFFRVYRIRSEHILYRRQLPLRFAPIAPLV